MKRLLIWLFTEALSVEVNSVRYVPDWNAIAALAGAAAAAIGLAGIWYSIRALRRQLRHQTELEAKRLEERLLLRVMDLVHVPYNACRNFVADLITWRLSSGPSQRPEFLSEAGRKVLEAHGLLSTATAAALSVLRRSRPRRFPRRTQDRALEQYDDLVQRVLAANARMLEYCTGDWTKLDVQTFQDQVGATAFDVADLLRRVTGDVLARMYSDEPEWRPFRFERVSGAPDLSGRVGFNFADDPPLGRRD